MKEKGGRPTKYSEDILQRTCEYLSSFLNAKPFLEKDGKETILSNPKYSMPPYLEELALILDIDDETIIEWAKIHADFSAAIKNIKKLQLIRLYGLSFDRSSATGAIFQMKVNHNKVEVNRNEITGKDGNSFTVEIVNFSDKPNGEQN